MELEPRKLYYKIREVCRIVGVEAHVLRFWEKEFPALSPPKNKSGHRTYRPKDIELLLEIRRLLYDEGFTIAGARKRLGAGPRADKPADTSRGAPPSRKPKAKRPPASEHLGKVKAELENILTLLDRE
jgi:DNA-binding transcriptional MerR regulator